MRMHETIKLRNAIPFSGSLFCNEPLLGANRRWPGSKAARPLVTHQGIKVADNPNSQPYITLVYVASLSLSQSGLRFWTSCLEADRCQLCTLD